MYAELQRMVEQSQAELVEAIATKQREAERHAQELARGLENELSQLKRRSSELEAQAQVQDRLLFLQVPTSALSLGRDGADLTASKNQSEMGVNSQHGGAAIRMPASGMLGFRSIIHGSTAETAGTNMLNMHLGRS